MHNNLWLIQIFRKILRRLGQCTIGGNLGSGISQGINRMIIAAAANVRLTGRRLSERRRRRQQLQSLRLARIRSRRVRRIDARNDNGKSERG